MHYNAEFYYVGKIPCTGIGRPSKQRRVVLRRRNTVVGGKCALPNALIVSLSAAEKSLISPSRQHWTELIPKSSLSKRNAFPHFIRIIAETWRDGAGGLRGRRRRRPVVYRYICALSPRQSPTKRLQLAKARNWPTMISKVFYEFYRPQTNLLTSKLLCHSWSTSVTSHISLNIL